MRVFNREEPNRQIRGDPESPMRKNLRYGMQIDVRAAQASLA
jgi:hypothetical protein